MKKTKAQKINSMAATATKHAFGERCPNPMPGDATEEMVRLHWYEVGWKNGYRFALRQLKRKKATS